MAYDRFTWRIPSNAGTWGSSGHKARYPATRLADIRRSVAFRTVAPAGASSGVSSGYEGEYYIECDMGQSRLVGVMHILDQNLYGNEVTSLEILADSSPIGSTPASTVAFSVDILSALTETHLSYYLAAVQAYRYWQLRWVGQADVEYTISVAAFAEFVHLGPHNDNQYWKSPKARRWGLKDLGKADMTKEGQWYKDFRAKLRTLELQFPGMPYSQMKELYDALRLYAVDFPIFYSVDHDLYPVDWLMYAVVSRATDMNQIMAEIPGENAVMDRVRLDLLEVG